jgi:hypothetical protein
MSGLVTDSMDASHENSVGATWHGISVVTKALWPFLSSLSLLHPLAIGFRYSPSPGYVEGSIAAAGAQQYSESWGSFYGPETKVLIRLFIQ